VAVHGVDAAGYQSFFNNWTAKGFVPVLVSATGEATNAIFAAVFEQGIAGPWPARHGMTSGLPTQAGTFQHLNVTAHDQKLVLRSCAIYGTAADRLYAAVWHANPNFVKWHVHAGDTAGDYQTAFNAETQLPGFRLAGYRPASVHPSPSGLGQRAAAGRRRIMVARPYRQHAGHFEHGGVPRQRHRLGLCRQHPRLAAEYLAHPRRSWPVDRQADRRDTTTMAPDIAREAASA
jgi:hypothetical protein